MRSSREEMAKQQIGHTDISPGLARIIAILFVATVLLVPISQHVAELVAYAHGERDRLLPQAYDALTIPATGLQEAAATPGGPATRLLAGNRAMLRRIEDWESSLDELSVVGGTLRPGAQRVMSGLLRAGNEQAYCGREGWLFYRPAVDHLTGPGFLVPGFLERRAAASSEWQTPVQPDPRLAIIQFRQQLAERGIELLVMPVPVKAAIHPEQLSSRYRGIENPLRNPSFDQLVEELRAAGVLVLDPAPLLMEAGRSSGTYQYLQSDTHWRPEAVELVAEHLAEMISEIVELDEVWGPGTTIEEVRLSARGDLAAMLELPVPDEEVTLHQVVTDEDSLWTVDPSADVLVLGDSFANIYSLPAMGWGESAGLIEHLSHRLQRPLDAIVRNDNAAFATRMALSQELARGRDRLAGKRLVIWELTARELSAGDWKLLPMTLGSPQPSRFIVPPGGESWQLSGTIAAMGTVPRPRSAPYADYIVALHLVDLQAGVPEEVNGGQALVFVWAMRDYTWTSGARYRVGQQLSLRLRPWAEVADELSLINRGEIYDPDLMFEEPCWGEEIEE